MASTSRAKGRAPAGGPGQGQQVPVIRMRSVLGMALEEYRLAKGLGLNELAKLAAIEPAQLSRLEGGHQATARAATLRRLAAALDVEVDHLMRLAHSSRKFPITTAVVERIHREANEGADVSAAIERDPTIPAERKRWLHECVALARMAK
jgi:transcriptional regulator with XRE-family HTH domain